MASPPQVAVLVKLGGAAITDKQELESLDGETLQACARLLAALHRRLLLGTAGGASASSLTGSAASSGDASAAPARLVIVHGAGSFGHQTAAAAGVAHGGLHISQQVRTGFAATRASVTKLNHLVVSALLAEGVPAVGLSPLGAWATSNRAVAADGCAAVAELLAAGLVPVLHGDAVLDEQLGCTILSGDLIVSRLCERFRPPVVAFLTNVDGIFDRPPQEPGAQLISLLEVRGPGDGDGSAAGAGNSTSPAQQQQQEGAGTGRDVARTGTAGFTAFNQLGQQVAELQTSAAAHDTTGGVATKIREAAAVARLGAEVRIARAGSGPAAEAACSPAALPAGWVGTRVVLRR